MDCLIPLIANIPIGIRKIPPMYLPPTFTPGHTIYPPPSSHSQPKLRLKTILPWTKTEYKNKNP